MNIATIATTFLILLGLVLVLVILPYSQNQWKESFKDGSLAILVVSIGDRPFYKLFKEYFQNYANKTGATLLLKEYNTMKDVPKEYTDKIKFYHPNSLDREKFRKRMMKMVFLAEALEQYERVLLLDDSCFVMPDTPDIFKLVPKNKLGAVKDYGLLGELNGHNAINTGVLLVSQEQKSFFENYEENYKLCQQAIKKGKFKWVGVDQSVINYGIETDKMKVYLLPGTFNIVSTLITDKIIKDKSMYIYHLTGTFENLKLKRAKKLVSLNPLLDVHNKN